MSTALVWLRQDLRLQDNPALYHALNNHEKVIVIYILDDNTSNIGAAQYWWLHHSLNALQEECNGYINFYRADAQETITSLVKQHNITEVYWNRRYEPAQIKLDSEIKKDLQANEINVHSYNAFLLIEPWQVQNKSGEYFKVFTPFWRAAQTQLSADMLSTVPDCQMLLQDRLLKISHTRVRDWQLLPESPNWAAEFIDHWRPGSAGAQAKLERFVHNALHDYDKGRDIPGQLGTSRLAPHLHFGEISIRQIWHAVPSEFERYLAELGWREFSYHLLYHYPELPEQNFRRQFDAFAWRDDAELLQAWQRGQTGYPIVDAGMRELWHTGYMHNRVRMVVASFLTKHLLQDWRHGAKWFESTLLDADLASNTAGWQWTAGCGADAAPYFRIFNPITQGEKFDVNGHYVKRWCPELEHLSNKYVHQPWQAPATDLKQAGIVLGETYPEPIVDHAEARQLALQSYEAIKS